MSERFSFTINRSIWLRGEGGSVSSLLRSRDNKRCCIGIFMGALGVPDEKIAGFASIQASEELTLIANESCPWTTKSETITSLYTTNDYDDIPEKFRESKIAQLFASQGIDVTFVDNEKEESK